MRVFRLRAPLRGRAHGKNPGARGIARRTGRARGPALGARNPWKTGVLRVPCGGAAKLCARRARALRAGAAPASARRRHSVAGGLVRAHGAADAHACAALRENRRAGVASMGRRGSAPAASIRNASPGRRAGSARARAAGRGRNRCARRARTAVVARGRRTAAPRAQPRCSRARYSADCISIRREAVRSNAPARRSPRYSPGGASAAVHTRLTWRS